MPIKDVEELIQLNEILLVTYGEFYALTQNHTIQQKSECLKTIRIWIIVSNNIQENA